MLMLKLTGEQGLLNNTTPPFGLSYVAAQDGL
jgi:hypothetical protein